MSKIQPWKLSDVLEATGGRLVQDGGEPAGSSSFSGICTDTRMLRPGELFVALTGEQFDGYRFVDNAFEKGAVAALVNESHVSRSAGKKGENRCWIVVKDTLRALGDLGAFRRRKSRVSVVGITGTNGKTTTKEMTAAVLRGSYSVLKTEGNFNNLVGLPLTLLALQQDHEWAVLELGMNHPGEIARLAEICNPQIGVITNIDAGHLEGLGDLDGVMKAKGELLDVMGSQGTAVLNIDNERLCRLAERYSGRVISYGIERSAQVWAHGVSQKPSHTSFDLCWSDQMIRIVLRFLGRGAVYNALAAAAVGLRLGLTMEDVKQGLESLSPIHGRMEVLQLAGGIHVLNDTYNANPGSMAQAIGTLCELKGNGRGHLVTGDMRELGDYAVSAHKELGGLVARSGISHLFCAGDYASVVAESAVGAGMSSDKVFVGTKDEIVTALKSRLGPGDWVLVKGSRLMAMEEVVVGLKTGSEGH